MAEKPIVTCQFNTEPHELDDERQRVVYGASGGVVITDEVVQALTDEAEAGYDLDKLRQRDIPIHRSVNAPGEPHMCECGTANCLLR